MSKVIVFGSLNTDISIEVDRMPSEGETISGKNLKISAGGKGANQAVAASKMGAETYLVGSVGFDEMGENLIKSCESAGVNSKYVLKKDIESGNAIILREKGNNRIVLDSGANSKTTFDEVKSVIDEVGRPGDIFVCQLECANDVTIAAIKYAKTKGLITFLNPSPFENIDFSCCDTVVINEVECEAMTGVYPSDTKSIREASQKIFSMGVNCAIITLGSEGSYVVCRDSTLSATPPKIITVDTTSAGDTFLGSFVASISLGLTLEAAHLRASVASALTCTKIGAQDSIPTLSEVLSYMQ